MCSTWLTACAWVARVVRADSSKAAKKARIEGLPSLVSTCGPSDFHAAVQTRASLRIEEPRQLLACTA
jgi:hypothetical protein